MTRSDRRRQRICRPAEAACFERDGYYAKDDSAHKEAIIWAGQGADTVGLCDPADPNTHRGILEGRVPEEAHPGKRGKDGEIHHRPSRKVTRSAPESVSLMALIGDDERIVAEPDSAVQTALGYVDRNAVLRRMTNDSGLFRTRAELEEREGARPTGGNCLGSPVGD